jgi:hypothetical protein
MDLASAESSSGNEGLKLAISVYRQHRGFTCHATRRDRHMEVLDDAEKVDVQKGLLVFRIPQPYRILLYEGPAKASS